MMGHKGYYTCLLYTSQAVEKVLQEGGNPHRKHFYHPAGESVGQKQCEQEDEAAGQGGWSGRG